MTNYIEANIDMICNFGLTPIDFKYSPVYLTARQYMINPNIPLKETVYFIYTEWLKEHIRQSKNCLGVYRKFFNPKNINEDELHYLERINENAGYVPWIRGDGEKFKNDLHVIPCLKKWWRGFEKLFESIETNGFKYDAQAYRNKRHGRDLNCQTVTGHILSSGPRRLYPPGKLPTEEKNEKTRVFISQGKTRASIFFALFPDKTLKIFLDEPKLFHARRGSGKQASRDLKKIKNSYFLEEANTWPGVSGKGVSLRSAEEIFKMFLESDDTWLSNSKILIKNPNILKGILK